MIKSYKYRLYPNKKQQKLLTKHFGCARWVYNWGLEKKTMIYQETGKSLSSFDLIKQLPSLKSEYNWLKEVNSQSLQMALRNLDDAFQKFFKKQSNYPKFKKKHNKQSCQFPQHSKVDFKNSKIYVVKFQEGIKCKFHRQFEGKIKTVTISQNHPGKYYASILVENNKELPQKEIPQKNQSIGIDLGIKHFAVLSNDEKIENPKHLIKTEKRLKRKQKQLSRKKKGSSNRERARKRLAVLHEKVANQRKDFLHKLSKRLIDENQAICLEDLNVSGMLKNHKLAKHISDVGWGMFRTFLEYKADWYGKNVFIIDRFYPSSKMCHQCGNLNDNLQLSDRSWICDCGAEHDRDVNAAINIKNFAFCTSGQEESQAFGEDVRLSLHNKQSSMNEEVKYVF